MVAEVVDAGAVAAALLVLAERAEAAAASARQEPAPAAASAAFPEADFAAHLVEPLVVVDAGLVAAAGAAPGAAAALVTQVLSGRDRLQVASWALWHRHEAARLVLLAGARTPTCATPLFAYGTNFASVRPRVHARRRWSPRCSRVFLAVSWTSSRDTTRAEWCKRA